MPLKDRRMFALNYKICHLEMVSNFLFTFFVGALVMTKVIPPVEYKVSCPNLRILSKGMKYEISIFLTTSLHVLEIF